MAQRGLQFLLLAALALPSALAQATEPEEAASGSGEIQGWITDLDADTFRERNAAARNLKDTGARSVPALIAALDDQSPQRRYLARHALFQMADTALPKLRESASPKAKELKNEIYSRRFLADPYSIRPSIVTIQNEMNQIRGQAVAGGMTPELHSRFQELVERAYGLEGRMSLDEVAYRTKILEEQYDHWISNGATYSIHPVIEEYKVTEWARMGGAITEAIFARSQILHGQRKAGAQRLLSALKRHPELLASSAQMGWKTNADERGFSLRDLGLLKDENFVEGLKRLKTEVPEAARPAIQKILDEA